LAKKKAMGSKRENEGFQHRFTEVQQRTEEKKSVRIGTKDSVVH